MKTMERNNFDNKIEVSKYIFSEAKERFTEENARKTRYVQEHSEDLEKRCAQQAQYVQERADELTERFVQELQYKQEMLDNLNKGKSR